MEENDEVVVGDLIFGLRMRICVSLSISDFVFLSRYFGGGNMPRLVNNRKGGREVERGCGEFLDLIFVLWGHILRGSPGTPQE